MSHRYFEEKSRVITYSKYRSIPPKKLIDEIITFLNGQYSGNLDVAIDVGCGSGQSTSLFAPYFDRVIGTDISAAMIETARESNSLENVLFRLGVAEKIFAENGSVQLLSCSAAAHWFDLPKYFEEGQRILCPNGVLSMICYEVPHIRSYDGDESLNSQLKEVSEKFYKVDLGQFVPNVMDLVHRRYVDIVYPDSFKDFQRVDTYYQDVETTVPEIPLFFSTLSPFPKYCNKFGDEKGNELLQEMEDKYREILIAHGMPEDTVLIKRISYFVLMARKR